MKKLKIIFIPILLLSLIKLAYAKVPGLNRLTNEILHLGATTSSYEYFDHSDEDSCFATTVDSSGNYYCAGSTYGSVGEENGGQEDAFITKVGPDGIILWTRQLGATTKIVANEKYNSDHDACLSVAVDSSGNVYCGGRTDGNLAEENGGDDDAFVLKLDSNGNVLWARQFGETTKGPGGDTSEDDACYGVAVDASGNVYCGGYTASSIGEVNGDDIGVGVDAMVFKLDPNGSVLWVKQLGGVTSVPGGDTSKHDECMGIALDTAGNIYCAGGTESNLGETNAGGRDVFAMKMDPAGTIVWIKQMGMESNQFRGDNEQASNEDDEECFDVAVDSSGNVYCAGATEGAFGELNGGNGDAFVMKFTNAGAVSWITQLGATTKLVSCADNSDEDKCLSVAVDASGNVYCGGQTNGSIGETNAGQEDVFAIKLDNTGKLISAMQLGLESNQFRGDNEEGSNEDQEACRSIAVDTSGNAYCAGTTSGDLGEMNAGAFDAFVMKFQL